MTSHPRKELLRNYFQAENSRHCIVKKTYCSFESFLVDIKVCKFLTGGRGLDKRMTIGGQLRGKGGLNYFLHG